MSRPFYITTPIYYVNDRPHIGHSYTTVAADLMARFQRLCGREAFMLTGSDEHGTKIAEAAEAAGMKPQAFCDEVVEHYKRAWRDLDIDNNDFIRTTDKRHIEAFRKLLVVLKNSKTDDGQDVIYPGIYEGLYCTGCENFLTDKDLVDGVCPHHNIPPRQVKEKNYFFRLSSYLGKLRKMIETDQLIILPDERRREVIGLFDQGLNDFSLSRERVKWGIPLPFDDSQNAYVWIDALSNYITAIGYGADETNFKKWWYEAETVHFMAKDILKFHCIYWPAMLLAASLPLPNRIFLHGFFTIDGQRMAKSLHNQIDPGELVEKFGTDATRFLLLTQYPFGADGDIQRSRFVKQYNSALANDLGNLVSRVAKMITASFEGRLPGPADGLEGYQELIEQAEQLPETVGDHLRDFRITAAIDEIFSLVRAANRFFDLNAPWKLVKDGQSNKAGGVLYACAEVIRIVATLLHPLMPGKTREILTVFGLDDAVLNMNDARTFFCQKPETKITIKESIFPRLKNGEKKPPAPKSENLSENLIDIAEFGRVEMVTARILAAENVKGADKLLRLQIDLGHEKRQIVAGVAEHYRPEDIIDMNIIVVKNLKPAKIRGVESNGMLLAAHAGKKLVLVVPDGDIPPGSPVG